MIRVCLFFLAVAFCWSSPASAEATPAAPNTCRHISAGREGPDKRIAIVVGNGAYVGGSLPALPNPTNDAVAVAETVSGLGFEVFLITDATDAMLKTCLSQAYLRLQDAEVGLFYYSGHGIQIRDENFLVTTNARPDLKTGFVSVQPIVDEIQRRAAATLVFLDACRNNPLAGEGQQGLSVSTGRGIKVEASEPTGSPQTGQARGLFVAYATSPNMVALDGTGSTSPFTAAFIRTVTKPGYSIQRVMGEVTRAVGEETGWGQTPWMKSSLTHELKLNGGLTFEEARAFSDDWAAVSNERLGLQDRPGALAAALKGLPANVDDATLALFPKAYAALYTALRSITGSLPATGRYWGGDVSGDRGALLRVTENGDQELELWSRARQSRLKTLFTFPGKGRVDVSFSPRGTYLISYQDDLFTIWDAETGAKRFDGVAVSDRQKRVRFISSVQFSPDEKRLLVDATDDARLKIFDISNGRLLRGLGAASFPTVPQMASAKQPSLRASFSGNDAICVKIQPEFGAGLSIFGIYRLSDGAFDEMTQVNTDAMLVLVCDPNGKYIGVAENSEDTRYGFRLWNSQTRKLVMSTPHRLMATFFKSDPSGRMFAAVSGSGIAVYDIATGTEVRLPGAPAKVEIHPPSISRAPPEKGGLASSPRDWFSWSDLRFGPTLVDEALAELPEALRASVRRERISFHPPTAP